MAARPSPHFVRSAHPVLCLSPVPQRNAYILGFGLLFAVLGWRILELDRQIYEVKKHNEEIDEQKKAQ